MELQLDLYPGCEKISHTETAIQFITQTWEAAAQLNRRALMLAELAYRMDKCECQIINLENQRVISIPISAIGGGEMESPSFNTDLIQQIHNIGQSAIAQDCDDRLTLFAHSDKKRACWIVDQQDQSVLLANRVAVEANQKPPQNILASDISALWEPDSLRSLVDLVEQDRKVTTHTNIGYRWKKEGSVWWRAKHEFVVDYAKIWYLGRPCRFEVVQAAIPQE